MIYVVEYFKPPEHKPIVIDPADARRPCPKCGNESRIDMSAEIKTCAPPLYTFGCPSCFNRWFAKDPRALGIQLTD
jgi:hypothetical protein